MTAVGALGPRGDFGGGKFCAAVRCTGGVFAAELVGVSSIKSFKATQLTAPNDTCQQGPVKCNISRARTCVA